jgi:hypothetical protein
MRCYIYLIKGWPVVATDQNKADHERRGALVGVFDDDRAMAQRLRELLEAAALRARAN